MLQPNLASFLIAKSTGFANSKGEIQIQFQTNHSHPILSQLISSRLNSSHLIYPWLPIRFEAPTKSKKAKLAHDKSVQAELISLKSPNSNFVGSKV